MIFNLIFGIVVYLLDQLTKIYVEKSMAYEKSVEVIKGVFRLTYVKNRGVAFGAFQNMVPVIAVISLIAVVAIIFYFYRKNQEHSLLTRFGFIFIIAGAFGNLTDRIFRGYVVDFFDFYGIWHYIFNVADVAINVGIVLMILEFILDKDTPNKEKKESEEKKDE